MSFEIDINYLTQLSPIDSLNPGNIQDLLNKQDFNSLLNEPLLSWVDFSAARQIIDEGGIWLDVRLPAEYRDKYIKGSINIPLIFLRMKSSSLDNNKKYVIYCDTGRRSSAASFLLNENDITSYVLRDGVDSADAEIIENNSLGNPDS